MSQSLSSSMSLVRWASQTLSRRRPWIMAPVLSVTTAYHGGLPASMMDRRTVELKRHQSTIKMNVPNQELPPPTLVYSDNHILAVNKPPGWHVVPTLGDDSNKGESAVIDSHKCLLTELQRLQWGGGSQKTFLKPLHRIDQPCSGIVLMAKTSKAASRIAKAWKAKQVQKSYLCLIQSQNIEQLKSNSISTQNNAQKDPWWKLEGYLLKRKKRPEPLSQHKRSKDAPVGWNVIVTPHLRPDEDARHVSIQWRQLMPNLLQVKTNEGARHLVRALLSQIGQCPILGDSRYGSQHNSSQWLKTSSVGLHAFSITLPDKLKLGTTTQRYFEAPIPFGWRDVQGRPINDDDVHKAISGNSQQEEETKQ